ncbi:MAG TPA: hypothetical protein VG167_14405 [Verrucomicrobiae bacterium]|nr:hypothetical protein [Verrucomicrobiae bacterium]
MSLMDAFLLDPLPVDVWLALRTDGAVGSGTQDDPFDGSTVSIPGPTVSSITAPSAPGQPPGLTAIVTTSSSHGFQNGALVLIDGADEGPSYSPAYSKYYNGTFVITVLTSTTFSYQMIGAPSTSPASGTITCRLDPYRFDAVMYSFQSSVLPVTVHLGPGTFQTKGYTPTVGDMPNLGASWTPPTAGMKILGSGINVTTLQLVRAVVGDSGNDYFAIGGPYNLSVSAFEAADFTVDCNMAGQPSQTTTCAAIAIGGNHVRLRRIRAINFGTQCVLTSTECFALASGGLFPVESEPRQGIDCIIEDCIVEQPSFNNTVETTCIGLGGSENDGDGRMNFILAPAIRRCHVNCEYRDRPVPIASLTISAGVATVTTSLPHGRAANDWVRISGAEVNGNTNNSFNGAYKISNVSTYTFQYTPNPSQTTAPTGGDMWVGRWPSLPNGIVGISGSGTVTVQTAAPHFLAPGSTVQIGGTTPGDYGGAYQVNVIPTSPTGQAYEFTYTPSGNPGWISGGFIGVSFFVLTGGGSTASVVEGNIVLNAKYGGPHHDTFTTRDQTVRNNYFRAVMTGSDEDLETLSYSRTTGVVPLASVYNGGSGSIATATTKTGYGNHGFVAGNSVVISGASGSDGEQYYNSPLDANGVPKAWTVLASPAPTATTFAYDLSQWETSFPTAEATNASYVPPDNQRLLYSLTYDPTTLIATATVDPNLFSNGHGLSIGDAVLISKAPMAVNAYNGRFIITWVSASQFQYQLTSNPGANSTAGYYGRVWQTHNMALEANILELIPTPSAQAQPIALNFGSPPAGSPPIFVILLARRNVVRHVDGLTDSGGYAALAISVVGCGGLTVEDNVVDLQATNPIAYNQTQNAEFFANAAPGGSLVQGYNAGSSELVDEISTTIQDGLLLGL